MGTRGAVGIVSGKKWYVTYNHLDSYPDHLGKEMVALCRNISADKGWERLKERVLALTKVRCNDPVPKSLQKQYAEFADTGVSTGSLSDWYCLLRNIQGAGYIEQIYLGTVEHLIDSLAFLQDSVFCEFAYIINLDRMTLDFYIGNSRQGQAKSPLPFAQKPYDGYYPVRLVGSEPLQAISDTWMQKHYPAKRRRLRSSND